MRTLILSAAIPLLVVTAAAGAGEISADDAMAQLKSLAGSWAGEETPSPGAVEGELPAPTPVNTEFRVVSGGSVVMETQFSGTDHEMINMYHLDGDELVLTHYCAAGNQPTMRLDRASSTPGELVFEFTGGSNFDAARDMHIHSAVITLLDEQRVDSAWTAYAAGKPAGVTRFSSRRRVTP